MIRSIILLFVLTFLLAHFSLGQDIHFTQSYASPLTLNPANTGDFHGDWRITNNFRNQWAVAGYPFRSITLGYDQPLHLGQERFGIGALIVTDEAGPTQTAKNNLYASVSYQKIIKGNTFNFAVQPGYAKTTAGGDLTWTDQWDMGMGLFNITGQGGEQVGQSPVAYFDLNAGVNWAKRFGKFVATGGLSVFHLSRPKSSIIGTDFKLPMRKALHAGGFYPLNEKFFIKPNFLYMWDRRAADFNIGSNVGYRISTNPYKIESFFAGLNTRGGMLNTFDMVSLTAGVNITNIDIGVSYDINLSDLAVVTGGRGAFEFSIIYTAPSTQLEKVTIPCDRY